MSDGSETGGAHSEGGGFGGRSAPETDVAPAPPSFWRAVGMTFEATFRNIRTCLVLVSVYAVLNGVASALGGTLSLDVDPTRASFSELLVVSAAALAGIGTLVIVGVFVYPPTLGALSLVGSGTVAGDELDTHGVVGRILDRALEAIGAFVLTALILLAGPIAVAAAAILVYLAAGAAAAFGALVFTSVVVAVPMVYVFVRLSLAVPVAVQEGLSPVQSLRRSWELVRGRWWWVFGVGVVVTLAANVLSSIASMLFSLGNAGLPTTMRDGEPNFVLAAIGATVGAAVMGSIVGVLSGVVYASLVRERPPAELSAPAAEPVAPPSQLGETPGPEEPSPPVPVDDSPERPPPPSTDPSGPRPE